MNSEAFGLILVAGDLPRPAEIAPSHYNEQGTGHSFHWGVQQAYDGICLFGEVVV